MPASSTTAEEEVSAFLGRAHYQRAPATRGYRNGTRPPPIAPTSARAIAGARSLGLCDLDHRELERLRKERQIGQAKVALTT